jgi:hypothetical protein
VGDEQFKSRFANEVTHNVTLEIFPHDARGVVRYATAKTKHFLKARPKLRMGPTLAKSIVVRAVRGFRRLRISLRNHGAFKLGLMVIASSWRQLVFSRVEVLVFEYVTRIQVNHSIGIDIREGKLSELACLDELLAAETLNNARERLRIGDKLFTAWKNGKCVHTAWTRTRSQITATSEVGEHCCINLDHPAVIIYDCWTPPNMRGMGIYPTVISWIAALDKETDKRHFIYCRTDNPQSVRGIANAGFQLRYRMQRTRLLGYLTFSRVENSLGNPLDTNAAMEK